MSQGSIELFYEEVGFIYPNPDALRSWIMHVITSEDHDLSFINIIFCTDEYLLNINQEYLKHDYFTDIITFQYESKPIEGELFISLERVNENATNMDIPWITELHRVIIHGVLHLIGYNDKLEADKLIMRAREDNYLSNLDMNAS